MLMQAFVDESGGKRQGSHLVLVGVYQQAEAWAAMVDEWQAVLDEKPSVTAFHMYEAMHRKKQFGRWSRAELERRLDKLANVVNRYPVHMVGTIAHVEPFNRLISAPMEEHIKRLPKRMHAVAQQAKAFGDPYTWCFNYMIATVGTELYNAGWREQFEIIFDEKSKLAPLVKRFYSVFREGGEPEVAAIMPPDPLFRSDEQFVPLQLSDMIAYVVRCQLEGDFSNVWALDKMRMHLGETMVVLDEERIRSIRDGRSVRPPYMDDEQWARFDALAVDLYPHD